MAEHLERSHTVVFKPLSKLQDEVEEGDEAADVQNQWKNTDCNILRKQLLV